MKREAARLQRTIVVIVEAAKTETNGRMSDRHASRKCVKTRHTLWVIPCEKEMGALFQSQESRSDHSE